MEPVAKKHLRMPPVDSKEPGSLALDNYIIHELFLREDFPQYFTEEERTFDAIVAEARRHREVDEQE